MSQDSGTSHLDTVLINSSINAGRDINLNVSVNRHKDLSILTRLKTSLTSVPSASYNSYESKQRSECFPNTRVQVLNEIEAWITSGTQQAPIYILDGVAGIGKSTIAQTIAVTAAKMGLLGASFFFSRDEDLRKVAKHFFPTIAFQLACYDDTFAAQISASLDKNPDAPTQRLSQQLLLLLLEPLRDLLSQRDRPTLIVVDALDECENEDAHELLSLLGQHTPKMAGLKILITTRPEWHLRQVLDRDPSHERFRLHDIEKSIVQSDIHLYLQARLSPEEIGKICRNLRKPWRPSAHDMKMLCGICGTLFIFAATATKFILHPRHLPQKQLSLLLEGVSPDDFTGSKHTIVLDETYLRIICATQTDSDEFDENWFRDLNRMLGALIILANPLSCDALASLLDMDANELEANLSDLHSLIAPTGDGGNMTFRIHHKSFPDFITNMERIQRVLKGRKIMTRPYMASLLWIDINSHHLQLAKACLRVMNLLLKWNMADIKQEDWYKDKKDIPHVVPSLISQDLTYASMHWAMHLLCSRNIGLDVEIYDYLDRWSSSHILHWIEVMVILNQVDKIGGILQDAIFSIQQITADAWSQRPKVEELISDCSRFIQQGSAVMKISPIHIYRSCLPFIPMETSLYQGYGATARLQIGMERNARWDPLLITCVGHSRNVTSVAFSSDGSYLASGSWDGNVRLWDAKTGAHLQTLTGYRNRVLSIAFSHDSSQLLSVFRSTAWLWEVKTGRPLITLTGRLHSFEAVAFSSDSLLLGSGSRDKIIRLWDATTGTCIATLNGHSGGVNAVEFSKDGSRLVSGSEDKTIRIWDIKTRACILTLTGHSDAVKSALFSNDGSQLASGSKDKTVRLWDAKTGTQIYELVGHLDEVNSVAFSSDDSTLASGSQDTTIRLWDAKSGTQFSTLSGHTSTVQSVVFSNDDSRLASGSSDNTVRLWDTNTHTHQSSPSAPTHSFWVNSIAFSKDGSRLASVSGDNTLQLWDARTGVQISVLADYVDGESSVAFLGDGSRLAFGCDDNKIQILDAENETHSPIVTLTGHDDSVISVAFPKDGSQLASGSEDKTIRTWDAITGALLATLTDHFDEVRSVAFSNNGLRLASGSSDHTVQVWDTGARALIHTLTGHTSFVVSVAFSNDDSFLAFMQYDDPKIYIWDVVLGALKSTIDGAAFSLSTFISFVFLTCDGGTGPRNHTSLLLLVRKDNPRITGLVKASIRSWNGWEIDPLCWFPPDMEGRRLAFNQAQFRAAVGFQNGRVMVIDFSSERSRLY